MMNFTIDRDFVTPEQLASVKEQIKEFTSRYNERMLFDAFADAFDTYANGKIIVCDMLAFQNDKHENVYKVDMVLDAGYAFDRIHFFIDQNFEVDMRNILHYTEHYGHAERY